MAQKAPPMDVLPAYMPPVVRTMLDELARQDGESASGVLRSLVRQEAERRGIAARIRQESQQGDGAR